MRLVQIHSNGNFNLVERTSDIPPYAILSHTWGPNHEEVTYQDLMNDTGREKIGYRKLIQCATQAGRDGLEYFWSDTCAIDKSSSAELSEAINSMYSWYQEAEVCYAYLADVVHSASMDGFSTSRWFTRGWTLQELIAPEELVFYDREWNCIGTRLELREHVSECTRIPTSMLARSRPLEDFSIAQRMSWASKRTTTRIEDMAYCLLGIFDINMPLIYGEGENAFLRLQEEIMRISDDHSLFAWRSNDDRGGCLATSPASFHDSSNIVQSNALDTSYEPAMVSSRGIHLDTRFVGCGPGKLGFAILNCRKQDSENESVAIYLRDTSHTMRHFERVKSEKFAQFGLEAFQPLQYPIRRLCIQKKHIKSKRGIVISQDAPSSTVTSGGLLEPLDIGSPISLLETVKQGSEDDVWLLLTRRDADLHEEETSKKTALHYAAANGKGGVVKMLISRPDVDINSRDVRGRTPVLRAAAHGYEGVVQSLLDTGKVDVNLKDENGRTALSWAAARGYQGKAVVQVLLKTGRANANIRDDDGRVPLSWAVAKGGPRVDEVCELLSHEMLNSDTSSKTESGLTALSEAVGTADNAIIKSLIGTGKVDVNLEDKDGLSPLLRAVIAKNKTVVKQLVDTHKADVNVRDKDGRTPLSWAATTKERGSAIVKLLLEIDNVDVNSKDNSGRVPLSIAVTEWLGKRLDKRKVKERLDTIKLLLDRADIDVNSRDKDGRTPLSLAVEMRTVEKADPIFPTETIQEVIHLLLSSGKFDIDARDNYGRTPLSWAAAASPAETREFDRIYRLPIVKQLLKTGSVDIRSKDNDGRTPLDWAAAAGHNGRTVVKLLKKERGIYGWFT